MPQSNQVIALRSCEGHAVASLEQTSSQLYYNQVNCQEEFDSNFFLVQLTYFPLLADANKALKKRGGATNSQNKTARLYVVYVSRTKFSKIHIYFLSREVREWDVGLGSVKP